MEDITRQLVLNDGWCTVVQQWAGQWAFRPRKQQGHLGAIGDLRGPHQAGNVGEKEKAKERGSS